MLLKDKTAIITGGSKGLGKEITISFLEQGVKEIYNLSRTDTQDKNIEETQKKYNGIVKFKKCDISNETEVNTCINEIITESAGIDIIVNNAGINLDNFLYRMTTADWKNVINVNLTSIFYICKAAIKHMLKRKSGTIINISSVVGLSGNAGQVNYSASKAGIIGFTKSLAKEVAMRGIRVNAIAPGFIDTGMSKKMDNETLEKLISLYVPLARLGKPKEIADVVVFLGSDMSSFITGQVIRVDGGSLI